MSQAPAKANINRFILMATVLLVAVVVGIIGWQRGWFPGELREPKYDTPALSADYLPADTAAVLHVNMRETQDSKFVQKEFGTLLRQFREQYAPEDMQKALGFDVTREVDWMQLTMTSGDTAYLIMMAGKFEPVKFKAAPKGLRQMKEPPGERYRVYEMPYPSLRVNLTLTANNDLLLMSDKPARVKDALEAAAKQTKPALEDKMLAGVLGKVERTKSIWWAASLKHLELSNGSEPPSLALSSLQSILKDTDAVYGGITCGDGVQGTVYFLANSEEKARELETVLRDLCKTAKGDTFLAQLALNAMKIPEQWKPFLKFLGTGVVKREGSTVALSCHLP